MSGNKDEYEEEDIVFALVSGYPWWPGFVAEKCSKKTYKVTFFGDFSYSELGVKNIKPFSKGLKQADLTKKDLNEAICSAKRVKNGQSTIEEEHKRTQKGSKKSRKTKAISKKKKKGQRLKKVPERGGNARSKKRGTSRAKDKKVSQSMIQEPSQSSKKQKMDNKKREAKLNKSMETTLHRVKEISLENNNQGNQILEELFQKDEKKQGKSQSESKAKPKSNEKSVLKDGSNSPEGGVQPIQEKKFEEKQDQKVSEKAKSASNQEPEKECVKQEKIEEIGLKENQQIKEIKKICNKKCKKTELSAQIEVVLIHLG